MLGQALSNPEKMITVPTGCGEQNMATTVPNIYLLQHLRATETVTTLESKIIQNIKIGGSQIEGSVYQSKYIHVNSTDLR